MSEITEELRARPSAMISGSGTLALGSLMQAVMRDAYAKAERSRRKWHMARLTSTPDVAARFRRQMLKHQALAYHLDKECRGCHEPG
jgi:hypothetical protein